MYIIMYVSTMLMLLVLMTYGRMESFRGFGYVQSEFSKFMETTERQFINEQAFKNYEEKKFPGKSVDQNKNDASPWIIFNFFIDKDFRDRNHDKYNQHRLITENFIRKMYGEELFYKNIEEKRGPDLASDLLDALIRHTDPLSPKERIKRIEQVQNIKLADRDLDDALFYMLKGTKDKGEKIDEEAPVEEGYYPLRQFISFKTDNNLKMRVYLAPEEILAVLFVNPKAILEERSRLFSEVRREGGKDPKDASEEFKSLFLHQRQSYVEESILDFTVSKTNPKYYN